MKPIKTMLQLLFTQCFRILKFKIKSSYILLFFGVLFFSSQSFAQNLENESLIVEYLGEEKYNKLTESNPAYLKFLDTRYSYGYSVMDYVDVKMSEFPVIEIIYHTEYVVINNNGKEYTELVKSKITAEEFIIAFESDDFNFLEYQLTFDRTEVVYYILGNTGKVIMIASVENINNIVNKEN